MSNLFHLLSISSITGFLGDALLQFLTKNMGLGGQSGWGLKSYFTQHGSIEALFIASGMMSIFYVFYLFILGLQPTLVSLAIYGIILDLLFRKTMWFPSLKGYYNHLNYFWSAFWGAIPMILPLLILQSLTSCIQYSYLL